MSVPCTVWKPQLCLTLLRRRILKPLVEYLAVTHEAVLRALTYVPTFRELLTKHEQNKVCVCV